MPSWYGKCPPCKVPFDRDAPSTNRDAIMMMIARKIGRIGMAVRSLRSTGCRARIIIFVDAALEPTEDFLSITNKCECEIVYVNLTKRERSAPHLARFIVYKRWLDQHYRELDRVMHTDAFDVFFQHDPFESGLSKDALDVVLEDRKIKDCPWNSNWIKGCYGNEVKDKLRNDVIACSGSIGGSAKEFRRFLKIMVKSPKWEECWEPSIDQAHLNYLLYSGKFEKDKIPINFHNCNSSFLTMTWCSKNSRVIDNHGLLLNPSGEEPAFVHQYNRYSEIIRHYENICPT